MDANFLTIMLLVVIGLVGYFSYEEGKHRGAFLALSKDPKHDDEYEGELNDRIQEILKK